jgi:uncharacterized protein YggE
MDLSPVVSVRGACVSEVEPEIATLDVLVSARDREREDCLRSLDARSSAVLALVTSFGEAVERVETAGVRIGPEFKDNKPRERVVGYSGAVRHRLLVVDFTRIGDLVARLAEQDMVDVVGPWWQLRADSPVYRAARIAAAQDALARAREYADALGSTVVGLVEMADTGLLSEAVPAPGGPYPVAPMAMRAPAPGGGVPPAPVVLDLEPVRQTVRANVEARFTIAPPTSL